MRLPPILVPVAVLCAAAPLSAQDTIPPDSAVEKPSASVLVSNGIRVCAGGDVTLGTNLDTGWVHTAAGRLGRRVPALPSPDSLLAPLAPLLADADVVLLNVEGAIGEGVPGRRKCAPGSTLCFAFRSPVSAAGALRRVAGVAPMVGNVANNHARDAGDTGWRATARHLRDAGAHVTGMDTVATVVPLLSGDTVAFLGYSAWAGPDVHHLASLRRHVRRAAERWPYVVVNFHAGSEGTAAQRTRNVVEVAFGESRGNSVAFAHAAIEAGANVVFGHGPHVLRAMEWYRDALVFYSLGNLVTYGPFSFGEPLNRGAIACADLAPEGGVASAELRSTRQRAPGIVAPDSMGVAAQLVDSLGRLDFPLTGARVAQTGEVRRPSGGGPASLPATVPLRRRQD